MPISRRRGANFDAGRPTIIALNLEHTATPVIGTTWVISIAFAMVLVWAAASFLAEGSAGDAESRAGGFGEQHP
jgi:hypothetical protein